jgi:hypothetical protein
MKEIIQRIYEDLVDTAIEEKEYSITISKENILEILEHYLEKELKNETTL